MIALVAFIANILNLLWDYKTRMLEAARGIFRGTDLDEISIADGSTLPGYIISNSIIAFIIVCAVCTAVLTILLWPLFWKWLWGQKFILLSVLVPSFIISTMEGYVADYIYEDHYIKNRCGAGIIDFIYFFLAILEGFGAAAGRLMYGIIALLLC